jgi:hypothetical protein
VDELGACSKNGKYEKYFKYYSGNLRVGVHFEGLWGRAKYNIELRPGEIE